MFTLPKYRKGIPQGPGRQGNEKFDNRKAGPFFWYFSPKISLIPPLK